MWFNRKEHEAKKRQWNDNNEFLKKEVPLGLEFMYLGTRMRVTGFWKYYGIGDISQGVMAEYLDSNGVLRERFFPMDEARVMFNPNDPYAVTLC